MLVKSILLRRQKGPRSVNKLPKVFMRSDLRETVDDVDNHLLVSVDDRETEADEMSRPAQNTINNWQGGDESARIAENQKQGPYDRRLERATNRLSGILVTLIAVLLVSLLFLFQSMTSFFSRK
jgi:hypothetical protein